jgi:hypothetical protein
MRNAGVDARRETVLDDATGIEREWGRAKGGRRHDRVRRHCRGSATARVVGTPARRVEVGEHLR